MIFQKITFTFGLAICTMAFAPHMASADLGIQVETPKLVLSDELGRPFYPTQTHVFAGAVTRSVSLPVAPQVAAPRQTTVAKSRFVVSEIPEIAPNAHPLTEFAPEPRHTARTAAPSAMTSRVMESWSVGVLR